MFSQKNRFSFKGGLPKDVFHSESFTLRYGKNDDGLKVAVVVSKKVDKRAVIRNKLKRKLTSLVGKEIDKENKASLVFFVKKQILLENSDLEAEVKKIHGII